MSNNDKSFVLRLFAAMVMLFLPMTISVLALSCTVKEREPKCWFEPHTVTMLGAIGPPDFFTNEVIMDNGTPILCGIIEKDKLKRWMCWEMEQGDCP